MSLLVTDCPRCGARNMTFRVRDQIYKGETYGWKKHFEVFSQCQNCLKPTIFVISLKKSDSENKFSIHNALVDSLVSLNNYFTVDGFISPKDNVPIKTPDHVPSEIANAFREGTTCLAVGCYNAAATMFRLCVDLVTRPLLPDPENASHAQPNAKQRRDLGLRLPWLFENGILPSALRELARCIHQDGNDGAHVGNLQREDADDLSDFTKLLLERLITEPKNLELAEQRRTARRSDAKKPPTGG